MAKIWTHKDLDVWNQAMELAVLTYRVTRAFPSDERYALASQMRRAAVSVLSNIAEGAARRTRPDFLHFLHVARGSLAELDAQAALADRLEFGNDSGRLQEAIKRVGQLLNGLIGKLKKRAVIP